jgi:aspartate carbamoyltransferase regulatory subunit
MFFRVIIDVHYANHTNYKFIVWVKYRELMLNLVVHIAIRALLNYITDKSIMEKVPYKYNLDISIIQKYVRCGNSKSFDSISSMALQPLLGLGLP